MQPRPLKLSLDYAPDYNHCDAKSRLFMTDADAEVMRTILSSVLPNLRILKIGFVVNGGILLVYETKEPPRSYPHTGWRC